MISLKNISKAYAEQVVLKDVSLSIAPGAITGLVGPSGSGKTSLLRIAALLEEPDSGTVATNQENLEHQLGIVFQQLFLWPHLTLHENMTLASRVRKIDFNSRYQTLLEKLDLVGAIYKYPREASLGQKQRAALIRALLTSPKYLLLDEPTSALDNQMATQVSEIICTEAKNGVGILLISHHQELVRNIADAILHISDGRFSPLGHAP